MRNLILLLTTVFICNITSAQEAKYWRSSTRDGRYEKESGLPKKWDTPPQMLWSVEGLGKGFSSPIISSNKLYVTGLNEDDTREILRVFSLDGKKLWEKDYGGSWRESYSEARATPTIIGNDLYIISGDGIFSCLNAEDGNTKWSINGAEKFERSTNVFGAFESPLIIEDMVIFTPGGNKTTVVALNRHTGETIWQSKSMNDHTAFCSPIMIEKGDKRSIITITNNYAISVDVKSGDLDWSVNLLKTMPTSKGDSTSMEYGGTQYATMPVYKDGYLAFSSGYDQGTIMFKVADDLMSATPLWRNSDLDNHHGGLVLEGGYLYGSNWITNTAGKWVCIDWQTGKTTYEQAWTGKSKGSIIYADGMLYCYDERRGFIGLVKPNPEKFEVVSEFIIPKGDGASWAHPLIENGILYVRHGNALMAYKLK